MKTLTSLLCLAMLLCCSPGNKADSKKDEPSEAEASEGELDDGPFALRSLPEGWQLDTAQHTDTALNLSAFLVVPRAGIEAIDQAMRGDLDSQYHDFAVSVEEMLAEGRPLQESMMSDFYAAPVSVYADDQVISSLFVVSYYHAGAAHPLTMYYAFNFDGQTHRRLQFENYFTLTTVEDSLWVRELIADGVGVSEEVITALSTIDFNVEGDTISFNFDNYEVASYAAGILQGRLHRQELAEYIREEYR